MARNGSNLIAIHPEETPNLVAVPLATYLRSACVNFSALVKDIQRRIAFIHVKGLQVGPEYLDSQKILIVESSEGPNAILTIQRPDSSTKPQEDISAAGNLYRIIWTSGSRIPDFLETDLISKMTQENTTMTASEACNHFAFWSSAKRLSFLKRASDILELKQRKHLEALEAKTNKVIDNSWTLRLSPVLQEKVERDSRKRRAYSGNSLADLLRLIRNLAHHYHELAPEVRAALGPREDLGNFWVSNFPQLLPEVHAAMQPFCKDTNCVRINHFYYMNL